MQDAALNPAQTNPALTQAVLDRLIAGEELVEPRIAAALAAAAITGRFECPYCLGVNDGILRVKNDGMGVESVKITLEWLSNPHSRNFCLCQLIIVTMQTGDEHRDTIANMERYILPIYRYFRIRLVELARGGELEEDGIVILQDTCEPHRLHREGFYKLSEHFLLNGTVPQAGSEHFCSLKWKVFVGEYWMEHCLQMHGFHHVFGYSADERDRVSNSERGIATRNEKMLKKLRERGGAAGQAKGHYGSPRVRVRLSGDSRKDYVLAEVDFSANAAGQQRDASPAREIAVEMTFGYNVAEGDRMRKATNNDGMGRVSYRYSFDPHGRVTSALRPDTVKRVGVYPLDAWAKRAHAFAATFPHHWLLFMPAVAACVPDAPAIGSRVWCVLGIYEQLGVAWEKSACVGCAFDAEASKCTEHGVERKKQHPQEVADALLFEYASLCLNERGMLYVKKSLQAVVFSTEQLEAARLFEQMLDGMEFSLLEVKRVFTRKGKAGRSVVKVATGTREEMSALFHEHAERLDLPVKTLHGINYAVFAQPTYTEEKYVPGKGKRMRRIKPEVIFPAVEGFLVVAPAAVGQKVRGRFEVFESRFAHVARFRGFNVPKTPGTALVTERKHMAVMPTAAPRRRKGKEGQGGLFELAA
jgi:hypothetical protein